VAGEMGLAVLAAKDLVGVEVGVVDEAHDVQPRSLLRLNASVRSFRMCQERFPLFLWHSRPFLIMKSLLWWGWMVGQRLEL